MPAALAARPDSFLLRYQREYQSVEPLRVAWSGLSVLEHARSGASTRADDLAKDKFSMIARRRIDEMGENFLLALAPVWGFAADSSVMAKVVSTSFRGRDRVRKRSQGRSWHRGMGRFGVLR